MTTSIKNIDPPTAAKMLKEDPGAVIIDVRSRVEYEYVGHPIGAFHVPWKEFPDWRENLNFCAEVDATLAELKESQESQKDRTLLMLCRSGVRSLAAGEKLREHGYSNVFNIEEGFEGDKDANNHRGNLNGWRKHGLAWEQG